MPAGSEGVWVVRDPEGRIVGTAGRGAYDAVDDARGNITPTRADALMRALYGHLDVGATTDGWSVQRLPLATPEMVECVNAVREFGDLIAKLEKLTAQGSDLSERFDLSDERTRAHGRLLLAAERIATIDAARAAGGT